MQRVIFKRKAECKLPACIYDTECIVLMRECMLDCIESKKIFGWKYLDAHRRAENANITNYCLKILILDNSIRKFKLVNIIFQILVCLLLCELFIK